MSIAALDPQNRSLATWFAGVVQPDTNDGAQTARWVMDLLDHVMERKASAILDGDVPIDVEIGEAGVTELRA